MTPLYLTRFSLSHEVAIARLVICDSYDWHQRIWELFPGRDDQPRDYLYRVDRDTENFCVLVQSRVLPTCQN